MFANRRRYSESLGALGESPTDEPSPELSRPVDPAGDDATDTPGRPLVGCAAGPIERPTGRCSNATRGFPPAPSELRCTGRGVSARSVEPAGSDGPERPRQRWSPSAQQVAYCGFGDIDARPFPHPPTLARLGRRFRRRQLLGLRQRVSQCRPSSRNSSRRFRRSVTHRLVPPCDGYRCRIARRRAARRRQVNGRLWFDHCGGHRGESRHRRQTDENASDQTMRVEDRTRGTCQDNEQDYRAEQQRHTNDRTNDRNAEQRLQDSAQDGGCRRRWRRQVC